MKTLTTLACLATALLLSGPAAAGPNTPPSGVRTDCVATQPAELPYPGPTEYAQTGGSGGETYARAFNAADPSWVVATTPCSVMGFILYCSSQDPLPKACETLDILEGMPYDGKALVRWVAEDGTSGSLKACELVEHHYGEGEAWACPGAAPSDPPKE